MDLYQKYNICIREDDKWKVAFMILEGSCELTANMMFFGLTNFPIDIDSVQKPHNTSIKECYYCKNLNYVVCKCLMRLDVWQLT